MLMTPEIRKQTREFHLLVLIDSKYTYNIFKVFLML